MFQNLPAWQEDHKALKEIADRNGLKLTKIVNKARLALQHILKTQPDFILTGTVKEPVESDNHTAA
jgi:hypothetical protein